MNLKSNITMNQEENQPAVPLPNPGEGGPVPSTPGNENRPVAPLPSPGEGGPAFPGGMPTPSVPSRPGGMQPTPSTPSRPGGMQPTPSRPSRPGMPPTTPVPSRPGTVIVPGIIGTIITTYPRPNEPCRFCTSPNARSGNVRFLNAASDYNPFMVYVNDQLFSSQLNFAEVTEYERVDSGFQLITVMSQEGYIYLQKQIMIPENGVITIAIIHSESGLDLFVISDAPCNKPYYVSCIRACNLSFNSGPLNLVIGDQYVTFMNVMYKEVTDFKTIWPGDYAYFVSRSNQNRFSQNQRDNVLVSSNITIQANVSYTVYMFNWNRMSPNAIRVLIVEEH